MTRWLCWILGVLATVAYALVGLLSYRRVDVHSWDLAIFEQAVAAYSRFEAPIVPVKGPGYHILGDHFSPVTALIAPFYRVFPDARTLLVVQAVLLGLSVVVVASVANRRLGPWLGTLVTVLYATSFGIQSAIAVDFHEVAFAVPLLALAGAAFVDGKFNHVVWWSLPLILVKEDLGFTVAAIGVALWFAGDRRRGVLLGVVGVLSTAVIVAWVIPYFNTGGGYDYVGTLGGEAGAWVTLWTAIDTKALTVLTTFAVTGFAALWSPWALAVVPTFAWRFLGDVDHYWGIDWHYSLVLMPMVFLSMIDTLVQRPRSRWPALIVAVATAVWWWPGSELAELGRSDAWAVPERAELAAKAQAVIPEGSYVESDIGLLTHLVGDHTVYWVGTVGDAQPDYLVFDRTYTSEDIVTYGHRVHRRAFTVIYDDGTFVVARRPGLG